MSAKHILFVEDKAPERHSFDQALKAWNAASPDRMFVASVAGTVAEALEKLSRHRFDCALFDLKLPSGEGGPGDGNDLVKAGLDDFGIPVGIISGNPQDVEADLKRVTMLKTFSKDEDDAYEDALKWLGAQWQMMDILAESRAEVRRSGAAMFPNRIWPNWQNYEALGLEERGGLSRIVARQYAAQIAEHLGIDGGSGGWHPFEYYISPAMLEDRPQTGDLFRFDGELWVLLTPACDLATGKAPVGLFSHCRITPPNDQDPLFKWGDSVVALSDGTLGKEKRKIRDDYFRSLVNQSFSGKHFLPPLQGSLPMFVEFKHLKTLPIADLDLKTREASIAPAFLSNLVQRFGAYMSRTGQPNIDIRHFG
ncbi:MAG: hypothetical protein ACK4MH_06775 [Brevundimonas sp.]|uniref:hypothetical protein n=1 Tax=Brevundimonas sp. TaxID=1871086 RepID=UPI00391C8A09